LQLLLQACVFQASSTRLIPLVLATFAPVLSSIKHASYTINSCNFCSRHASFKHASYKHQARILYKHQARVLYKHQARVLYKHQARVLQASKRSFHARRGVVEGGPRTPNLCKLSAFLENTRRHRLYGLRLRKKYKEEKDGRSATRRVSPKSYLLVPSQNNALFNTILVSFVSNERTHCSCSCFAHPRPPYLQKRQGHHLEHP
jgi:hypothetical protein